MRLLMAKPMPVPSIGPVSWPARWKGKKSHVRCSKAIGNEKLDRLADQLGTRIAEYLFGLKIDELDSPRRVGNDHGIRRSIEELAVLIVVGQPVMAHGVT